MTVRKTDISNRSIPSGGRRGFTLIELLVVIGIIVLVLALAVPLFSVLRGGRSIDSSQNLASAMLQRARSRAIGIQQRRGVLFFDDAVTGKTGMLMVQVLDTASNVLELDGEDEEIEYLPNGIGLAGLIPNSTTTTDFRPTCLILFDGVGRIETLDHYQIRPPGSVTTFLSTKYKINFNADVWQNLGYSPVAEASQAAFVLYDRTDFAQQTPNTTSTAGSRMSPEQLSWLDQNAVAIVMNRYNGTLIRGE